MNVNINLVCMVEMKYSNGSIYNGEWKHGMRNGEGVLRYRNDDVYKGNWVDGKKDGEFRVFRNYGLAN